MSIRLLSVELQRLMVVFLDCASLASLFKNTRLASIRSFGLLLLSLAMEYATVLTKFNASNTLHTSSLIFFDVVLLELRTLMYTHEDPNGYPTVSEGSKGYVVTPQTEVHYESL